MTHTVYYTQHELTQAEIDREAAKQAAIARNRARGAVKRKDHDPRSMDEMRHFDDPASDAAKGRFEGLLKDCLVISPDVHAVASAWWATVRDTITKKDISTAINRLKLRITEAKETVAVQAKEREQDLEAHTAKMNRDSSILGSMRVSAESARGWQGNGNYPRDKFTDVPDGYYAVATDAGPLAFYRVSTWGDSGNRKVQVQASDALHPMKGRAAADGVLAKVREVTPPVAGKLYADHLGNCWRCGRTLTDAESRARGIGPVCINK